MLWYYCSRPRRNRHEAVMARWIKQGSLWSFWALTRTLGRTSICFLPSSVLRLLHLSRCPYCSSPPSAVFRQISSVRFQSLVSFRFLCPKVACFDFRFRCKLLKCIIITKFTITWEWTYLVVANCQLWRKCPAVHNGLTTLVVGFPSVRRSGPEPFFSESVGRRTVITSSSSSSSSSFITQIYRRVTNPPTTRFVK